MSETSVVLGSLPFRDWQFYAVTLIALVAGWYIARPYLRARKLRQRARLNGNEAAVGVDIGCSMCSGAGSTRRGGHTESRVDLTMNRTDLKIPRQG